VQLDPTYFPLFRRSLLALLAGSLLVVLCYFFVDRPVAFFVQEHGINRHELLKWLTYPPPYLEAWAPAVLVALAARRAWGPFAQWERTLLAACVSLLVALQFKESLKFIFGRAWPDTWVHDNLSLIRNDHYGFHWLGGIPEYASFPSGHTTRVVSVVAVCWIAYPGGRWLGAAATTTIAVSLIGMNYHFVGDVIAGGFVGGLVGTWTAHFCGLGPTAPGALSPCENGPAGHSNSTG